MAVYILWTALIIVIFLVMLNGFLRYDWRYRADSLLSLVWLGLLVWAFWGYGLRMGLVALLASFALASLSKPLAGKVSRRLLGYRTGFYIFDTREEGMTSQQKARQKAKQNQMLEVYGRNPKIQKVLKEYGKTPVILQEQVDYMISIGVEEPLAWEIIGNPRDLRALLEMQNQGLGDEEIYYKLTRG